MKQNKNAAMCWCDVCESYRKAHYCKGAAADEKMTWFLIGLVLVSIILVGGYIDTEYYKLTDII